MSSFCCTPTWARFALSTEASRSSKPCDLLRHPDRVVGDVAEERLHPLVHVRHRAAGEPAHRLDQRQHRVAELDAPRA